MIVRFILLDPQPQAVQWQVAGAELGLEVDSVPA